MSRQVKIYRWIVFALAVAYFADRFRFETFTMEHFGWQFRYLTIWALGLSMASAGFMLTRTFSRRDGRAAGFVSVTAVVNALVVFSYWRLFFQDPELVNGGNPILAYREYYLHLAGPLLQWIDVLFIKRAFRYGLRTSMWLAALVLVYVEWAEFVVRPLNDKPVGTYETGLPYPFLNDMAADERALFYLSIFATGLVFVLVFRIVQGLILGVANVSRA